MLGSSSTVLRRLQLQRKRAGQAFGRSRPFRFGRFFPGIVIALAAANGWPLLLLKLGVPLAATAEATVLTLYVWWAGGGGPPRTTRATRATMFRRGKFVVEPVVLGRYCRALLRRDDSCLIRVNYFSLF
jgi:hypothetical protein